MSDRRADSSAAPNPGACTPARDAAMDLLGARLRDVSRLLRKASGSHGREVRSVHQLRVSTRRAGAALRVFRPFIEPEAAASARKRLRRIRRCAAAARRCDALRGVLRSLAEGLAGAERRASQRISDLLADRRRAARRRLRELHDSWGRQGMRRWRRSVVESCRSTDHGSPDGDCPLADLAPVALGALIEALRVAGKGARSVESLHRLRLAGKRVRYAVEVLSSALPGGAVAEAAACLATLQERLGEVNDLTELHAEVTAQKDRWESRAAQGRRKANGRAAGAAALAQRLSDRSEAARHAFIAWWEGGGQADLDSSLGALARSERPSTGGDEAAGRVVVRVIEPARTLSGAGA